MNPGNIDQLNFSVILDDKEFKARVQQDIQLAERLNTSLSAIAKLKLPTAGKIISDDSLKNIDNAAKRINEIRQSLSQMPSQIEMTVSTTEKHTEAVEETNKKLSGTSDVMRTISQLTGVAFGVAGLRRFASELINVTGQFEVQKMALTSMLQDAGKTEEIFNQLRKNALESPYTFQDLTKFAKQLTAFNIPVDQLVETEKRLADVAAGVGVDMGRIILAYGQVKAAGVLKGTELRQFTEAGVPLLQSLAEQIEETEGKAVSLSEVFSRISKKEIPFEMVEEAFRRMTSEGGKFYNMQAVLVETLQGKIGKLRDVWQQTLYDIGNSESPLLKGSVDAITVLVQNLDTLGRLIPDLVIAWGAYAAVQAVVEAGSLRLAVANSKVVTGLKSIGTWIAKNPYALLAAALAVVAVEAVKFFNKMDEGQKRLNKAYEDNDKALNNEIGKLDELNERLKLSTKGTKEWSDAKDEAVKAYGSYFTGLDKEIEKTGNLETAYKNLSTAIQENVRMRQFSEFEANERKIREDAISGAIESVRDRLYNSKYKNDRAAAFRLITEIERSVRGGVGYSEFLRNATNSGLLKQGDYVGDIQNIFATYSKYTEDYLRNTRAMVKEYGLQGTILDPDFIGPMPPAGASSTKTTAATKVWGKPESEKAVKDIVDIDKIMAEVDKDLAKVIEENTKKVDEQLDKRFKAMNDWDAFLDKWEKTGGIKVGEGARAKLSDYIQSYKDADYKVLQEYRKQLSNLETQFGKNSDAYDNGKKKLDAWRKSMEETNKTEFRNKTLGLADDIFKEQMQGYDLTNWGDKTLSQIEEIRAALLKLDLPEDIRKDLEGYLGLSDELIAKLKQMGANTIERTTDPEKWKKIAKLSKQIAQSFLTVAKSLKEYASATENAQLGATIDGIESVVQTLRAAGQGASWGGWVGALVGGIADITNQIIGAYTEAELRAKSLAEIYSRISSNAQIENFREALSDANSKIFGENTVAQITLAISKMNELTQAANKYRESVKFTEKTWTEFVMPEFNGNGGGWMSRSSRKTIEQLSEQMGKDLLDEYGNYNVELLEAIRDAGFDLTTEERKWLDEAIAYVTNYKDAVAVVDEAMASLFGDVASNLADAMIDQWIEAGDAALDYADILDDVAKAYSKMLIQSMIVDSFLDPITEDLKRAFLEGRSGDAMSLLAGAMQSIQNAAPLFQDVLSTFSPYFKTEGSESDSGSGSLGKGFQSLTEETGSLIASYFNAVRADVSVIRSILERGGGMSIQQTPNLQDYLQQIQASSADIAESNRAILLELQSVIRAPGSAGQVLHVEVD